MEDNVSISNAEMKVMGKIWEKKEMVTVQDMLDVLNEEGEEWAYQTVATFLKRLEAKNILASTKKGNKLCYYPLVSKEQYEKREARGFVKSKFSIKICPLFKYFDCFLCSKCSCIKFTVIKRK